MAGLNTMKATFGEGHSWSGALAAVGLASGPSNSGSINRANAYLKSIANSQPFGADVLYVNFVSVVNGTPFTVDLTAAVDLAGQTDNMVRVKGWYFHLLSATDLSLDNSTTGNACSGITVGGGTNPFDFGLSTTAVTFPVNNGSVQSYYDGSANGIVTSGTHKVVQISNGDAVNAAKVVIIIVGCTT